MTAQEYIYSELQKLAQPVLQEDIGTTPVEEAIFVKAMSKKFRKFKANDVAADQVKAAIRLAVRNGSPVKAKLVFGGNKLWRFEESPEIDWAELFSVMYHVRWLTYIASVYKPGAHLEFFLQDIAVWTLNNLEQAETDQYYATFNSLLAWLQPYIPENVTLVCRRQSDDYTTPSDYYQELEEGKAMILAENQGKLPQLSEAQKMSTELNVRLQPGQADDPQWREKVELEHQAIFRTTTLDTYLSTPGFISLSAYRFPGLIALGSIKRSYAKFWASVGALQQAADSFDEVLLTPKQLSAATFEWQDITLEGLQGKNFKRIRIVDGQNKLGNRS